MSLEIILFGISIDCPSASALTLGLLKLTTTIFFLSLLYLKQIYRKQQIIIIVKSAAPQLIVKSALLIPIAHLLLHKL